MTRAAWLGWTCVVGVCAWGVAPPSASAQAPDRLWGTVRTASGAVHEGFLRWDRNEASWADVLDGRKALDDDLQDRVAEALGADLDARARSVEFLGVRISWDDDGPPPGGADSGVRFGHLAWVRPTSDGTATLGLKSGREVDFVATSTDLGSALRALEVEGADGGVVELAWHDLERVDFSAAPAGADPGADRLWATVRDRWGDRWTGFVSWDRDEALGSDVLDGEDAGGRDREIRFELVASVERLFEGGARVVLRNGEALELRGTNDVDDGHRGVQIADPALGEVSIDWRDVVEVRFATPPSEPGYDAFDGGDELRGTVTTDTGDRFSGRLHWDADERYSWEFLDGAARGVDMRVEFGRIARISRRSSRSAEVELRDGRTLVLEGSNDVNRGNKGIVVELDDGSLQVVEWDRFEAIVFEEPGGASDGLR